MERQQPNVGKINLQFNYPLQSKYHLLNNEIEKVGNTHEKDPEVFINYSQIIDNIYGNLEDSNPTKKSKVLIVFDNMMGDMEANND